MHIEKQKKYDQTKHYEMAACLASKRDDDKNQMKMKNESCETMRLFGSNVLYKSTEMREIARLDFRYSGLKN